jgi:tRNA threonylcarbamoyladenosine biosynthesis protein TsaB
MNILAVDTALGACSAAVMQDDRSRAHRFAAMERGHAEALAPMVQEAMAEAGLAFADLDRLAVTTGPGTFTGQRVGLAFMRGLRIALKRPLIGITTLQAMAAAAMAETGASRAAVLHDARRGEVYFALYAGSDDAIVEPCLLAFDDAVAEIFRRFKTSPVAFAGTAAQAAYERYRQGSEDGLVSSVTQPDALWVARLALRAPAPDEAPRPLYLRPPDAKLPVPPP